MTLPPKTVNGGMVRAGEKFVVTEFLVKEPRRQSSCMEQPKLQGRRPELVPPAHTTKLVAMVLCTGEPSQVIEVTWRAFVTSCLMSRTFSPLQQGCCQGSRDIPWVPGVTLC